MEKILENSSFVGMTAELKYVEINEMGIEYKRLSENELDVFIEMRINQLRELNEG